MNHTSEDTICHALLRSSQRSTQRPALKNKEKGHWKNYSWTEYKEKIESVACALLSYGIKPGDKVAIMSNTRIDWAFCDFGILSVQAVTVPIYQTVTPEDLEFVLNNSEAKILFLENRSVIKTYQQVKDRCPHLKKVICFENTRDHDPQFMPWSEFLLFGQQEKSEFQSTFHKLCSETKRTDTATLIYTSGTTGQPKGVVLTHEQIMSEVSEAFTYCGVTDQDTTLTFLPYAHVMGRIELWGHMLHGYTMAFAESIEKVRSNLLDIQPTILVSVPRIFEKVYSAIYSQMGNNFLKVKTFKWALDIGLKVGECKLEKKPIPIHLFAQYEIAKKLVLDKVKNAFGGKLRFAISGGAPISRDIALFFHACDILILEGYGLTETTAAICVNTPFNYRFGSVGRPIGDVQLKIAEDGEILVKSKKVMKEYYKNKEATDSTIIDGWFHTGDIGEIMQSGDLKITDRKKDLIKTAGGKYVAPQKLENMVKLHSFVSNVLIHGDQKKYIVALITLDQAQLKKIGSELGIADDSIEKLSQNHQILEKVRRAIAETNAQLANFETIKKFLILPNDFTVESGELTPSLKVKRKVLDKKYAKQIEALYS